MNVDDTQALRNLAVRVLRNDVDPNAHQLAGHTLALLDEVDRLTAAEATVALMRLPEDETGASR